MAVFSLRNQRCRLGLDEREVNKELHSLLTSPWRRHTCQTMASLLTSPTCFSLLPMLLPLRHKFPGGILHPSPTGFTPTPSAVPGASCVHMWVSTRTFLMMRVSLLSQMAPSIAREHTPFPSPALLRVLAVLTPLCAFFTYLFWFLLPGDSQRILNSPSIGSHLVTEESHPSLPPSLGSATGSYQWSQLPSSIFSIILATFLQIHLLCTVQGWNRRKWIPLQSTNMAGSGVTTMWVSRADMSARNHHHSTVPFIYPFTTLYSYVSEARP